MKFHEVMKFHEAQVDEISLTFDGFFFSGKKKFHEIS
jgi:hypothetical protein